MEIKPGKNYLGDFLVESGEITQAQLDDALRYQKEKAQSGKKGFLGQILMELGYCTEETITRAMAEKAGVSYYSLVSNPVDVNAGNLITPEAARRYQSLPVAFENGRLVVAMMHPNDIIAIDDLRIMTGHDIKPVIVPDYELMAAIEQFSRTGTGVEKMEEEEYLKESGDTEDTKPAVQLADMIFYQAVASNASDVHIEPQEKNLRTRFRIDGVLHEVMQHPRRLHPPLISRLKVMANMDIAERRIPQDGRITMKVEDKTIDVRVASMPTVFGEKLTLRLLDRSAQLLSLTELGFPDSQLALFNKIMRLPYGFILVTGPTGSGKSTTLYASLVELNQVDKQIITLEDPIERRLEGINQVQVNLKAGMTFASGLRAALRNDPDIIMVGEIRDHETARIAVESALTGHLVLSTLHTNTSAGAVTRLGDMGVEPYLIASSLIGVVAQRLVRLLCNNCKTPEKMTSEEILKLVPGFPLKETEREITFYKPKGCIRCSQTGYRGRTGVYELLNITEDIQDLILRRSSTMEIEKKAVEQGMISLRQDGLLKVREGLTSLEELLRVIV